ncbi:LOW QUALITY PROTEIN: hypothetical protein PHMEG_0005640 [Phytophthora megakarya]|uniref:Uncharacterized protein n=1 Tax=Phytophthora megakarya TaxID=4795 RepID=A0A225WSE2_9STRA|nr:LOW QUALITY PROTEIN: hypothetical protein PHMEG_0005640 [Phytophthora megakarya]
MVTVDWEDLTRQRRYSETRSARVLALCTRTSTVDLLLGLCYIPKFVSPVFADRLGDVSGASLKQLRKRLKPLLDRDVANNLFGLMPRKRSDGTALSYSALDTHRAGLFNLYRDYGLEIPSAMEKGLQKYFKGLKRHRATAAARGEIRAKTGKDLCHLICMLFRNSANDMAFARTYMIIAWNLIPLMRLGFTMGTWNEVETLSVFISRTKKDQKGSEPREPRDSRHIYPNPLKPVICPVSAIATLWATSSFHRSDPCFPFTSVKIEVAQNVINMNNSASVNQDELGTHSMRNGAASYCAFYGLSVIDRCAPESWVVIRRSSEQLSTLRSSMSEEPCLACHLEVTILRFYPRTLANVALPSNKLLLYITRRICEHISQLSTLCGIVLVQHPTLIADLSSKMCGIDDTSNRPQPTGVPPHVVILREIKALLEVAMKTIEHIDATRTTTVRDIMTELEQRAIGARVVTFDGFDSAFQQWLESTGGLLWWRSLTQMLCKLLAINTLTMH